MRHSDPNSRAARRYRRGLSSATDPRDTDPRDTSPEDGATGFALDPVGAQSFRRGRPSIAEAEALSGRILDASWDVLLATGFEGFTFDRVARQAHVGKATIYSRFTGKIDLMQALLLRRIEQRSALIFRQASNLPVEQAFQRRASDVMKMLFAPDGVLMERLIDWLDQEIGEGQRMRANAYRTARESIIQTMRDAPDADSLIIPDFDLAARLWLEGLIGHARLANSEGASSTAEIERWATNYTQFYFAGLRALAH